MLALWIEAHSISTFFVTAATIQNAYFFIKNITTIST